MTDGLRGIVGRMGDFDVVLAPSYEVAKQINLAAAREHPDGAFATVATTFWAWVEGLWEREGDGRVMATDVQVSAVVSKVLSSHEGVLANRPGLAVAALGAMGRSSGLDAFERAVAGEVPEGLLPAERELLECVALAREELSWAGLVERGVAAAWLQAHAVSALGPDVPLRVALVSEAPLRPLEGQFLDACAGEGLIEVARLTLAGEGVDAPVPARVARPPEGVRLRFAFPAGPYATGQLVAGIVDDLLADGPMVVSSRDPVALYDACAPELARRGVRASVRGRRPWGHTVLGRAYLSLLRCLACETLPWDRASLADVLESPLMRMGGVDAWSRDVAIRGNRLLPREVAIDDLCGRLRSFRLLHTLVTQPSRDTISLMEESLVTGSGLGTAELSEELDALSVLRELVLVARRMDIPPSEMAGVFCPLLERVSIAVRRANFPREVGLGPQVSICGQVQAAQTVPGGCASMVVLDLDSDSYPASRKDDSLSLLLAKLGVPAGEGFLDARRRDMAALAAAPTRNLVLGRCLNDASAEPRYHCAVLEEFVDLYRDDPTSLDDIDNDFSLPLALQEGMYALGEEDLVANVRPGGRVSLVTSGDALPQELARPLVASRHAQVEPDAQLVLSPAQIEAYLSCPHKWFATRRVHASGLDEGLGPRETGTFRHDVLQEFYQRFRELGYDKLTPSTLEQGQEVYGRAFEGTLLRHLSSPPGSRAPFLMQTTEARILAHMERELWNWLRRDADVLAPYEGADGRRRRFVPTAFEFELADTPDGPGGRGIPFPYAGAYVTGRVDRIDMDPVTRRAVVLDYKGSVGPAYDLSLDEQGAPDLSKHIQALVYAHVIGREPVLRERLGIEPCGDMPAVVGALYVSYRRGNAMRGAYVANELSEAQLPYLESKEPGVSAETFAKALGRLEELVAENVVERIRAGYVDPAPRDAESCRHCAVTGCPRRR